MGHMTQPLVDDIHQQVFAFEIGAPAQGFRERLSLEEHREKRQMSFVIVRLYLRTKCRRLESRNGGNVDLAKKGVKRRSGICVSEVFVVF